MIETTTSSDLYKQWERFVNGSINLTGVRREIVDSWRRCRDLQINPYEQITGFDKSSVNKLLENNLYLLEVVNPFLDMVHYFIKETGFMVVLTDGNGMVLELQGDEKIVEKAKANHFCIGANRSEKVVGTNAIGLAIIEGKPIQTVGPEHYNKHFHCWTCSAAPIHDSKGNIIGVLNVSGDKSLVHQHTLGMMASIVQAMERELHIQEGKRTIKPSNKKNESNVYFRFEDIIGNSSSFRHAINIAQMVAQTDTRVLLEGESGTGKELFAQSIHHASNRKNGPFIAVNCSAIPKELIESELFGYSDGAFTGAKKGGKPGKFEQAQGGTLFLDEINSMPLEMQAKLLRVLQQNEVTRIGAAESTSLDIRVIAASNESLESLVKKGQFRNDLFYRLGIIIINIPPLRERIDDIPILSRYLLNKICRKLGKFIQGWDERIQSALCSYDWPGNVRELENYFERAAVLAEDSMLTMENFPQKIFQSSPEPQLKNLKSLDKIERESIIKALELFEGNISKASRDLGISRNTLYNKIKFYNIHVNKNA